MDEMQLVREAGQDPQALERLYRAAASEGRAAEFAAALAALHAESPDSVLYAAWHYRLAEPLTAPQAVSRGAHWKLAVPLSLVCGLAFWALSGERGESSFVEFVLLWAPIAAVLAIAYLALAAKGPYRRALLLALGLAAVSAYARLTSSPMPTGDPFGGGAAGDQYLLMALHLPLMAWAALGLLVLGWRSGARDRFAFLSKSVEVAITAGLYLIVGGLFGAITIGLFAALDLEPSEMAVRLLFAGGFGLIPVLAVATSYDPSIPPAEQEFGRGLTRLIATLLRLLLPLALVVLVIYAGFIPFRFLEPFQNRGTLIIYNILLFAVMGLLIGVTPAREEESESGGMRLLGAGVLALTILAEAVSLYALAAIIYRTVGGGFTPNRLAVLGWNLVNIAILALMIYRQLEAGRAGWIGAMHRSLSNGAALYAAWGLLLILLLPWLF